MPALRRAIRIGLGASALGGVVWLAGHQAGEGFLPDDAHLLRQQLVPASLPGCTINPFSYVQRPSMERIYWSKLPYRQLQKRIREHGVKTHDIGGSSWEVSSCDWGGFASTTFSEFLPVQFPKEAKSYIVIRRAIGPDPQGVRLWLWSHGWFLEW
jgi:hypothetical protein